MHRSKRILALCHCLLNSNAKVFPLAACPGVQIEALRPYLDDGVGLVQLPCPETVILGLNRWGMTREQYDQPFLRRAMRDMLQAPLDQLEAFARAGYELLGLVGVDGSPSCGVRITCEGFRGGEPSAPETDLPGQARSLREVSGQGVFIQVLTAMARERGLSLPLLAVDERNPRTIQRIDEDQGGNS